MPFVVVRFSFSRKGGDCSSWFPFSNSHFIRSFLIVCPRSFDRAERRHGCACVVPPTGPPVARHQLRPPFRPLLFPAVLAEDFDFLRNLFIVVCFTNAPRTPQEGASSLPPVSEFVLFGASVSCSLPKRYAFAFGCPRFGGVQCLGIVEEVHLEFSFFLLNVLRLRVPHQLWPPSATTLHPGTQELRIAR